MQGVEVPANTTEITFRFVPFCLHPLSFSFYLAAGLLTAWLSRYLRSWERSAVIVGPLDQQAASMER
jgi:hypothetical protein